VAQQTQSQQPCPTCKGQGKILNPTGSSWQQCPICEGTGVKYDPGMFFTYRMAPVVLAANAVSTQVITILNRSFRWQELTGETTNPCTLFFTDLGTGRQFSNVAIHTTEILGDGKNPFPLLVPYVFALKSSLQITITDLGAGSTIGLAFIGTELGQ
jgi:hypothetical protein